MNVAVDRTWECIVGIIRRYHLSEYFPGEQYTTATADQGVEDAHYEIRDARLQKMLKNARKEGFTGNSASVNSPVSNIQLTVIKYVVCYIMLLVRVVSKAAQDMDPTFFLCSLLSLLAAGCSKCSYLTHLTALFPIPPVLDIKEA